MAPVTSSPDIKIAFPQADLSLRISTSATIPGLTVSARAGDRSYNIGNIQVVFQAKHTATFFGSRGYVEFRETWAPAVTIHGISGDKSSQIVSCAIQIPSNQLREIVDEDTDGADFSMAWQFVNDSGIDTPDTRSHPDLEQHESILCDLRRHQARLPSVKYARFGLFHKATSHRVDTHRLQMAMQDVNKLSLAQATEILLKAHEDAFDSMRDDREVTLDKLARKSCIVQVDIKAEGEYTGHFGQLVLRISTGDTNDSWPAEIGQKFELSAQSYFNGNPPRDSDGAEGWTASVVRNDQGILTAILNTPMPQDQAASLAGKQVIGVQCKAIDKDTAFARAMRTHRDVRAILQRERGEALTERQQGDKDLTSKTRIPMTGFLVDHVDARQNDRNTSFALRSGDQVNFPAHLRWKPKHQEFVQAVQQGFGGLAAAIGPPGTGKSELLSRLAALSITQFALNGGKVVMSAHSNQATMVLLEKCHEVFPKFGVSADSICWVEAPGATRRRRQGLGIQVKPDMEKYGIEGRISKVAAKFSVFKEYNGLHAKLVNGTPLKKSEQKTYRGLRQRILKQMRSSKSDLKVYLSTINNLKAPVFSQKGDNPFDCAMLMVDEASQCPMLDFLGAWINVDPRRLVIAGDPDQLHAYAPTVAAEQVEKDRSPIHVAKKGLGAGCVLLNWQYRMDEGLYHPTNVVHYGGDIYSDESTKNRADIEALRRQWYNIEVDPMGDGNWQRIEHHTIVFDVPYGVMTEQLTKSKTNLEEVTVLGKLLMAASQAGIPASKIMALSGYQAMYESCKTMQRSNASLAGVAVRKVDSTQGDERDMVIMTTVRAPGTNGMPVGMGFLQGKERSNVATSRQKGAVVIIGHVATLERNKWWGRTLNAIKERCKEEHGESHTYKFVLGPEAKFRCGAVESGSAKIEAARQEQWVNRSVAVPPPAPAASSTTTISASNRSRWAIPAPEERTTTVEQADNDEDDDGEMPLITHETSYPVVRLPSAGAAPTAGGSLPSAPLPAAPPVVSSLGPPAPSAPPAPAAPPLVSSLGPSGPSAPPASPAVRLPPAPAPAVRLPSGPPVAAAAATPPLFAGPSQIPTPVAKSKAEWRAEGATRIARAKAAAASDPALMGRLKAISEALKKPLENLALEDDVVAQEFLLGLFAFERGKEGQ